MPMNMKNLNVDSDDENLKEEPTDIEMKNSLATKHKDDGNESYKVGDYDRAIECYTRGIEVDAGKDIMCILYSNRSAALTIKRRWVEAGGRFHVYQSHQTLPVVTAVCRSARKSKGIWKMQSEFCSVD